MNCPLETRENAQLLLDYGTRKLEPETVAALERHIAICGACREFVSGQRAVWQALDAWEAAPVSADFDSRLYRRREGSFEQITEDHSLLNDYIKMKHLSPEEIAAFPHKNVIVRALGMKDTVQVDVHVDSPRLGDIYLLCSDGLSGMLSDPQMADVLGNERDLDVLCERLISMANKNGGLDNITVVAIRVEAT